MPAAAAALAALHALPALAQPWPPLRRPLGVEDAVPAAAGVALTFDDGPHAEGTPAVLEVLAARGARATFFLAGEQVERHPGLAREVAAAGHEIALHCHRHRNALRLTPGQLEDDLLRACDAIGNATGVAPLRYRPPYGVLTGAALRSARRHGWRTVLWTRWGRDWESRATPESIAERLTTGLRGGDVLLLHDADHYSAPGSWRRTAAALPLVLDAIDARGLPAVSLADADAGG